jgi:hypothetical protein
MTQYGRPNHRGGVAVDGKYQGIEKANNAR